MTIVLSQQVQIQNKFHIYFLWLLYKRSVELFLRFMNDKVGNMVGQGRKEEESYKRDAGRGSHRVSTMPPEIDVSIA